MVHCVLFCLTPLIQNAQNSHWLAMNNTHSEIRTKSWLLNKLKYLSVDLFQPGDSSQCGYTGHFLSSFPQKPYVEWESALWGVDALWEAAQSSTSLIPLVQQHRARLGINTQMTGFLLPGSSHTVERFSISFVLVRKRQARRRLAGTESHWWPTAIFSVLGRNVWVLLGEMNKNWRWSTI